MTQCNEYLQVKMYELKGILCDSLDQTTASMLRFLLFFFVLFWFLVLFLNFVLFWEGKGCKGRGQKQGNGEMSGIAMHNVKSTKNQ